MNFFKYVKHLMLLFTGSLMGCGTSTPPQHQHPSFSWFEYAGKDAIFDEPLADNEYQNPIVAGFYPDPSITRVGNDYYMVHSSFAYWPGLPIFHSTDLVNWRSLGHALTRADQVDFANRQVSEGIFAPTIRHHAGTFYIITTAVESGGNFILTADNPEGPWSDPIWLPEVGGIDPDLFFDDDGRVYIAHNDAPEGAPLYEGHRAIWLWEYDPTGKAVLPDSGRVIVNGGVNLSEEPIWIEAPHIFKKDGWYYLSCAEGGTAHEHSQVIFRTRNLEEPFVPADHNPILTQRDLNRGRPNPINNAGHADMVQTQNGDWWAVFLAVRSYEQTHHNTGRETFLLPVTWQQDWPIITGPHEVIPYRHNKPAGLTPTKNAETLTGNFTWRDDFQSSELHHAWNTLRLPGADWYELHPKAGEVVLQAAKASLAEQSQPAFIGRRQQHQVFDASTELTLPLTTDVSAGFAAFQNETHHYYLGVRRSTNGLIVFLERAFDSAPTVIQEREVETNANKIVLGAEGSLGEISFYFLDSKGDRIYLAENIDARLLSTHTAGGFVGTYLGMHARLEN